MKQVIRKGVKHIAVAYGRACEIFSNRSLTVAARFSRFNQLPSRDGYGAGFFHSPGREGTRAPDDVPFEEASA